MSGLGLRESVVSADGMGALVVGDRDRAAGGIVCAVRMRQCEDTRTQAGEQQKRDARSLDPQTTAEHRNQLTRSPRRFAY